MPAQNMGPAGPMQIFNINAGVMLTGVHRIDMCPVGPQSIAEGSFMTVRHAPGRWKHIMVRPVVYKMRGYNTSSGDFEYWQTDNPSAGPPSGVALTNKSIAAVIVDAFPTNE